MHLHVHACALVCMCLYVSGRTHMHMGQYAQTCAGIHELDCTFISACVCAEVSACAYAHTFLCACMCVCGWRACACVHVRVWCTWACAEHLFKKIFNAWMPLLPCKPARACLCVCARACAPTRAYLRGSVHCVHVHVFVHVTGHCGVINANKFPT